MKYKRRVFFFIFILLLLFVVDLSAVNAGCSKCSGDSCIGCTGSLASCTATCKSGCTSSSSGSTGRCYDGGCWNSCGNNATCKRLCPDECPCTAPSKSGWKEGSAPSGWISECKDTTSCSGTYTSCSTCSSSRSWYKSENVDNVPAPTAFNMIFNTLTLPLSTDGNLRTLVMDPKTGESVSLSVPDYSHPTGRGTSFMFRANNKGGNPDWINFTDSPTRSEDIIKTTSSHVTPFDPALGADPVLGSNYVGDMWVHNTVLKRCKNEYVTSSARFGFYKVNSLPTVASVTRTTGNGVVTAGVSQDCTTDEYTGREVNNPVSFSVKYTDPNNSQYNDIEALYVWFSNNTTLAGAPPAIAHISTSGTNHGSKDDTFGFMVRKENATWNSIPNLSGNIGNTGGVWGGDSSIYVSSFDGSTWTMLRVPDGVIRGAGGKERLKISGINVRRDGSDMIMDFTIEFLSDLTANTDPVADGEYRVFGGASDHFSLLPYNGTNLRRQPLWNNRGLTWKVDLTRPEFVPIQTPNIVSSRRMSFNVNAFDNFSGIDKVIGDAIRTGTQSQIINVPISSIIFTIGATGNPAYKPGGVPYVADFGAINWSARQYAYQRYNIDPTDHLWTSPSRNDSVTVDIHDSEGGGFAFYATAFDNACNMSLPGNNSVGNYPDIGSPWMMTKGGQFFSHGGSQVLVRAFAADITDDYDFNTHSDPIDTFYNTNYGFNKANTQLGSELMTANTAFIHKFLSANNIAVGAFRKLNYSEESNKSSYWYDHLYQNHQIMKTKYPERYNYIESDRFERFATNSGRRRMSDLPLDSYEAFVIDYTGDLMIRGDFVCNEKTLIMVNGNIELRPDITREDPDNFGAADIHAGCLFITNGSITINAGASASTTLSYPGYDLIEGVLLADNQVIILEADVDPNLTVARDGLKIHGSIYGFGSVDSPGIIPGRTLKLVDNVTYPAEAIHFDPRYLTLINYFFGGDNYTYMREIGWKPTSL